MPASESEANLAAVARRLTDAVRSAGVLALEASRKPVKSWVKAHNSPVSEVDIAVDALLKARLAEIVPDAAWLSEETEDDPARLSARRVWIVDPIDGTRAFLAGRPDWTVSVALVEDGRPIVAALYAPASEEFFLAIAGARRHPQWGLDPRQRRGRAFRRPDFRPETAARPGRRGGPGHRDRNPGCIRWRCVWRGWPTARSTWLSQAATAMTGTLRPPIFWCTKPAAL